MAECVKPKTKHRTTKVKTKKHAVVKSHHVEENECVRGDVTEAKTESPLFDATSIRDNLHEGVVDSTHPEEESNTDISRSETHCGDVTAEVVHRSESVTTCAEDSGDVTERTDESESHCSGDQEHSGEVKEHSNVTEDQVTDTDTEVKGHSEVRGQSCTLAEPVHKHVQESEQLHRKYLVGEQTNVVTSQHSPKERQIVTEHQGEVVSPVVCQLVTEDTVTVSNPKLLYPHSALAEVRTRLEQDVRSHHGLEAASHVSPVVACVTDVVRPLTEEQLATIYWNPELCHNEQFIEAFLQHIQQDKTEFYEIVLNYYRARNHLAAAEHDVAVLGEDCSKQRDIVWTTKTEKLTAHGVCGDKVTVHADHVYETKVYNDHAVQNVKQLLKNIRDHLHDELTLYTYEALLSRLQVESYLHQVYQRGPQLAHIPPNSPVTALLPGAVGGCEQRHLAQLKHCIGVLFMFQWKPAKDDLFVQDLQQWITKLVSTLLRVATLDDHLFILNHVLRCPAGVGKWASSLIQVVPPGGVHQQCWGSPLVDHFVTVLATLLMPVRLREKLLCQLQVSPCVMDKNSENPWIFVDSDGEEAEDVGHTWMNLHENDIMSFLNQLPLDLIFKHILAMRNVNGEDVYDASCSTHHALLKLLAFARLLIKILGTGFKTFSLKRYRQLNKRIAGMIRDIVQYVADHWSSFQAVVQPRDVTPECMRRLQVEFDQLFERATIAILSAQRLGVWQYLAIMPYHSVSMGHMWGLLCVMHQGCEDVQAIQTGLSVPQCQALLRDVDSQSVFEEKLIAMPISEVTYLLTTFANMARFCSSTEIQFIETVALEIFEIAYVCEHTREHCSKLARDLLALVVLRHPFIVSSLLQSTAANMDKIGLASHYLFRGLPLMQWLPTPRDVDLLREWLLQLPLDSPQNHLARIIVEQMNWSSFQPGTDLFLSLSMHRTMALLLVQMYRGHLAGKTLTNLTVDTLKPVESPAKSPLPTEQMLSNWIWQTALRLCLHEHMLPRPAQFRRPGEEIPDINEDATLHPIQAALKEGCPLANYVALVMTKYGHSLADVCCEGLRLLGQLVDKSHHVAAVNALAHVTPQFYHSNQYLHKNKLFLHVLEKLLQADAVRKGLFYTEFPGPIVKHFTQMIQNQLIECETVDGGQAGLVSCVDFWLTSFTELPHWHQDRGVLYVIDHVLGAVFRSSAASEKAKMIIKQAFERHVESEQQPAGVISSIVTWIASGSNMPSLLPAQSCAEFPWYAYMVLSVETQHEQALWTGLQRELVSNTKLPVEQALATAASKLKLDMSPASYRLSIYRWAQQAVDVDLDHPVLPLVWQQFLLLYLGRVTLDDGMPERGSVGERFFSSSTYNSLMKKMKKRANDAAECYHAFATQEAPPVTGDAKADRMTSHRPDLSARHNQPEKEFYRTLVKFFQGVTFWLDEPRLHDGQLYLPALPSEYNAPRLLTLYQNRQDQWLELVDLRRVDQEVTSAAREWTTRLSHEHQLRHWQTLLQADSHNQPKSPAARLLLRLKTHSCPLKPPQVARVTAPVTQMTTALLCDKSGLLYALRADFMALVDTASVRSSEDRTMLLVELGQWRHCSPSVVYNLLGLGCLDVVQPICRASLFLSMGLSPIKVYSERVSKHVALDCTYLELLPQLYKDELTKVTRHVPCKNMFSLGHVCKGPAEFVFTFQCGTLQDITQRQMDENRAEYKQLMIEALLPPPQSVCCSAVHIENIITTLIKLAKSSDSEATKKAANDVGIALFYHLTTFFNTETKFYPPTRQFFTACIEILGQEFISNNPSQSQPLLQAVMQTPSLVSLLLPNFNPNSSPELFVTIYDDLMKKVPEGLDSQVAFSLLSKFDVKQWLDTYCPPLSQRSALLAVTGGALCKCGQQVDTKTNLVFEIYRSHLRKMLTYHFPDHYGDGLRLMLRGSSEQCLAPGVWEVFLTSIGCPLGDKEDGAESGSPSTNKPELGSPKKGSPVKTQMHLLTYAQMKESFSWLATHFQQIRTSTPDLMNFGLYPRWKPYVHYLSKFLHHLVTEATAALVTMVTDGHVSREEGLSGLWHLMSSLYKPWTQPLRLTDPDLLLLPWIPDDADVAKEMVATWAASVRHMQEQFHMLTPATSPSPLTWAWMQYVTTLAYGDLPPHFLLTYHSHLATLPWQQFYVDLSAIDHMTQVLQEKASQEFVAAVVTAVNWTWVVEKCPPQLLPQLLGCLLNLLIHMATDVPGIEGSDFHEVLKKAESFPWAAMEPGVYEAAVSWLPGHYDATQVLLAGQSKAPLLSLLKVAAGFESSAPASAPTYAPVHAPTLYTRLFSSQRAYMRCVVQLLCRCSHIKKVNVQDFEPVVLSLMTDIESVVAKCADPKTQWYNAVTLSIEFLGLLNRCNPEGDQTPKVVMHALLQWLKGSPSSPLLLATITAAGRSLASISHMLIIVEVCLDIYFTTDVENTAECGWTRPLEVLLVPELHRETFLSSGVREGCYLTLYCYLLQQLPLSSSIEDERVLLNQVISWNHAVKPSIETEAKLLLWWHKVLESLSRQLVYGTQPLVVGRLVQQFLTSLAALAQDRTTAGLLGAIGFGRKSQLSLRFRLVTKSLIAFITAQLYSDGQLRLPSPATPQDVPPVSTTPQAAQTLAHLESLKHDKQYLSLKDDIDRVVDMVKDTSQTWLDAPMFLVRLVSSLFADQKYLEVLRRKL